MSETEDENFAQRQTAVKPPDDLKSKFSEPLEDVYLQDYVRTCGTTIFPNLEEAMRACIKYRGGGITTDKTGIHWQVRKTRKPIPSSDKEISLVRFPPKKVHVFLFFMFLILC
jgi:hypothetical protein